jgi:hypothetical protein
MSKPAIIDHVIPTTGEKSERIVEIAKITAARLKYLNRAATFSPTNGRSIISRIESRA